VQIFDDGFLLPDADSGLREQITVFCFLSVSSPYTAAVPVFQDVFSRILSDDPGGYRRVTGSIIFDLSAHQIHEFIKGLCGISLKGTAAFPIASDAAGRLRSLMACRSSCPSQSMEIVMQPSPFPFLLPETEENPFQHKGQDIAKKSAQAVVDQIVSLHQAQPENVLGALDGKRYQKGQKEDVLKAASVFQDQRGQKAQGGKKDLVEENQLYGIPAAGQSFFYGRQKQEVVHPDRMRLPGNGGDDKDQDQV